MVSLFNHLGIGFVIASLSWSMSAFAVTDPIPLRSKRVPFTPKEFYISDVIDGRADKKVVALLIQPAPNSKEATAKSVALQGGDFNALEKFILSSTPRNPKLRPVIIAIKKCRLVETDAGNNRVNGKMDIAFAFYLNKGEEEHLLEYEGAAKYSRPVENFTVVESVVGQSLTEGLKYFNTWINREAPRNIKLATGIKIHLEDYQKADDDTIYYASNRPLVWDDFRDIPRNNIYAAEVFAGFGFDQRTEVKDGIIHVTIATRVFLPKSASWVRAGYRQSYVLNHEQRHFDIAKIIGERFKRRISSANLTINNYEGYFGPEYLEALREMNMLQTQYDTETRHGTDRSAQDNWNRKIDDELRIFGIIRERNSS